MANKKRLIDANALTHEVLNHPRPYRKDFYRMLKDAPTVDAVEVVHAYWKYGTRAAICSECGFERHLDDNFGAAIACPNCGAKMDGDGNG